MVLFPSGRRATFNPRRLEHLLSGCGAEIAKDIAKEMTNCYWRYRSGSTAFSMTIVPPLDDEFGNVIDVAKLMVTRAAERFAIERDKIAEPPTSSAA